METGNYDLSVGNNFTASATKDFSLPLYKVTFDTDIAGATAYQVEENAYFKLVVLILPYWDLILGIR